MTIHCFRFFHIWRECWDRPTHFDENPPLWISYKDIERDIKILSFQWLHCIKHLKLSLGAKYTVLVTCYRLLYTHKAITMWRLLNNSKNQISISKIGRFRQKTTQVRLYHSWYLCDWASCVLASVLLILWAFKVPDSIRALTVKNWLGVKRSTPNGESSYIIVNIERWQNQ